jgi:phage-related protein
MTFNDFSYFQFRGRKSTELGLRIKKGVDFTLPEAVLDFVDIDGRSSDIIFDRNKFKDIEKTFATRLYKKSGTNIATQLRNIAGWLYASKSYEPLFYSQYDEYFYKAICYAPTTSTETESEWLDISFSFKCQPFMFRLDGEDEREIISGTALTNPEPFESLPLVSFNKTSSTVDSTLYINGEQYTFAKEAGTGVITIDSETGIAYKEGGVNVSKYCLINSAGYHPITLRPGRNEISYNNMNQVKIKPRWRNLAI